ncbi:hypothetical protein [Melghirimyces profundicolus]|uniref:hypothetical protein n=1 Tax=Melghirimyces profundicolus TaxID=1242148 RepID=UPI001FE97417|nr:hypothetical protein [Melghirimyces profundicolus]
MYELLPYVFGFPFFPISIYHLSGILDEEGPLGRMLQSHNILPGRCASTIEARRHIYRTGNPACLFQAPDPVGNTGCLRFTRVKPIHGIPYALDMNGDGIACNSEYDFNY